MERWQLALLGVLLYWVVAEALNRRGRLPEWVSLSGPLTTMHTQRGKDFLDRLAERRRFWRAWANVGVGVALVVMLGAFLFIVLSALLALQNPEPTAINQPRNVLVIPGLNDFLPPSVAPYIVAALVIGLVVHEGGHGLLCRVEDIDIESMGLVFLAYVPMGAFVEPDQESQAAASRGARTRMFAAGVTNNFAITVVAFALLFGLVGSSVAVAGGVPVAAALPDSPAADAGLDTGDRIVAANGQPVGDADEFQALLANSSASSVELRVAERGTVRVEREVFVTGAAEATDVEAGTRIVAVDGEPVRTRTGFRAAMADAGERATLTLETDGERTEHTLAAGPRAQVAEGGALAAAGAEPGSELVLVSVGGERVLDHLDVPESTEPHAAGDEVTVVAYDGEERVEYDVTLGGDGEDALIGVRVYPGVAGLTVDDLGLEYYPADRYLAVLGGDAGDTGLPSGWTDTAFGKAVFALLLPFAAVAAASVFPYNFPGFTGTFAAFYEVTGPLEPLGGGVFVLANVLFWTAWLNFNLAFFNCIPAFPLDGGHILRTSTESVVARLPVEGSYAMTKVVTVTVGLTMGLSLLAVVAVPQLLG